MEIGTSNGLVTEIISGIPEGTEILTDFKISGGDMPEQAQQGGNPFMPRPRNNNNNKQGNQPKR